MNEEPFYRKFCVIGLGSTDEINNILLELSKSEVTYISGTGMIIATFETEKNIVDIETKLKEEDKSYIVFEMTPGFFSANIKSGEIQEKLFGGPISNKDIFDEYNKMAENIMSFMDIEDMEKVNLEFYKTGKIITDINEWIADPSMDDLLDKINEKGMDSLSKYELDLLNKYSQEK